VFDFCSILVALAMAGMNWMGQWCVCVSGNSSQRISRSRSYCLYVTVLHYTFIKNSSCDLSQ